MEEPAFLQEAYTDNLQQQLKDLHGVWKRCFDKKRAAKAPVFKKKIDGRELSPANGDPPPESRSAKVGEDVNRTHLSQTIRFYSLVIACLVASPRTEHVDCRANRIGEEVWLNNFLPIRS